MVSLGPIAIIVDAIPIDGHRLELPYTDSGPNKHNNYDYTQQHEHDISWKAQEYKYATILF